MRAEGRPERPVLDGHSPSYGWYVRRPGVPRYLPVAVAMALGLMAKAMVVTLPCVLLLLDYWPLRRWTPFESHHGKTPAGSPRDAPRRAAARRVAVRNAQTAGRQLATYREAPVPQGSRRSRGWLPRKFRSSQSPTSPAGWQSRARKMST